MSVSALDINLPTGENTLHILWTTGELNSVKNMVFMYAGNSLRHQWWNNVHIIVWGAATELLVRDAGVQEELHAFIKLGGTVSVCRRCAENLGALDSVKAMEAWGNLKVYYVGETFTKLIKAGEKIISI